MKQNNPDKHNNFLKTQWENLFLPSHSKFNLNFRYYNEIIQKYLSGERFYHNLSHIVFMFELFGEFQSLLDNKNAISLAIFYHDIIYDPVKMDNEEKSAEMAINSLEEMGFASNLINNVKTLILATKSHQIPLNSSFISDISFFLDFDLAILGVEWPKYIDYAQNVRKEYIIYNDFAYTTGRLAFISKMLNKEHIYLTNEFITKYEPGAKQNLLKEKEILESGNLISI